MATIIRKEGLCFHPYLGIKHKAEVRNTQFPKDLEKAYELGKRLVGKCVADMTIEG